MEITGKIIAALTPREGTSKTTGNPWKVQSFVIETQEQYARKCMFEVFGADRLEQMKIQVGEELTVSFDIDAHEYNGNWYNSLRAWKVARIGEGGAAAPAAQASAGTPAGSAPTTDFSSSEVADDLPF